MKMKKLMLRAAAVLAAACLLASAVGASPAVAARCAILVDADSGRVLYEKDAGRRCLIASTTKIMTGLLIAEEGGLERAVIVPPEAAGVEGSSLYLKAGEETTVEALLYGLMLRSGNDAAVALAVASAGSVEAFVDRMNRRAAELGLADTHYANPNGLDDEENYSTARDLARLACAAMENPVLRQVTSTKRIQFGQRSFTNHNKLLWRCAGTVGVKTGYTKAAGRLLVSAAERYGRRLVAVTINDPQDWRDHQALLEFGFAAMTPGSWGEAGDALGAVPVTGGTALLAQGCLEAPLAYALLEGETAAVRLCLPRFAFAPIAAGTRAGTAQLLVDGRIAAEAPIVWTGEVPALE